jgi:hypothetical protein
MEKDTGDYGVQGIVTFLTTWVEMVEPLSKEAVKKLWDTLREKFPKEFSVNIPGSN